MADTKISALTALTGANVAAADLLPIVDTSATATKNITVPELGSALLLQQGLQTLHAQLKQHARDIFNGQVNCFTRTGVMGNYTGSQGTRFTSTSQFHRWLYQHTALIDCGDLRWVFMNASIKPFSGSGQGEDGTGNAIEVNAEATLVASSKAFGITFNGNAFVRLENFNLNATPEIPRIAISDYIGIGLDAADAIYGRYLVKIETVGTSGYIPTGLVTASSTLAEGTAAGSITAASNSGGGSAGYHPVAILGTPLKGTIYSFSVWGDSIEAGEGDTTTGGVSNYGYVERGLASYPHMRICAGGMKIANFNVSGVTELRYTPGFMGTHQACMIGGGANDIASDSTLANIKTWYKRGCREAIRGGTKRLILMTMLPYTDVKVNWTTLNGQVPGTGTRVNITGVANAAAARVTSAGHGLSDGNYIYVSDCGNVGPTFAYVDQIDANTFDLYSDSGLTTGIPSSGTFSSTHSGYSTVQATTNEVTRRDFNTWLRDGTAASEIASEIDATIPVTIWDRAILVETNSAGTLTANGGYWAASHTADGIHPNATGCAALGTGLSTLAALLDAGAY